MASSRIGASVGGVEDVLEQVEERRLGPVDVVDQRDHRAVGGEASRNLRAAQYSSCSGKRRVLRPTALASRVGHVGVADRGQQLGARRLGVSSSRMSAASRTMPTSGQKVMPSP